MNFLVNILLVIISRTFLTALIYDLGTYGDFSIEYDNNNNKSNFDLKQATNALHIFMVIPCGLLGFPGPLWRRYLLCIVRQIHPPCQTITGKIA